MEWRRRNVKEKNPDAELGNTGGWDEMGRDGKFDSDMFHLIFKTRRMNAQHLARSISGELRGTS